jgi:hypothetical protein
MGLADALPDERNANPIWASIKIRVMTEDVVLYRADVRGLKRGAATGRMVAWWPEDIEYTYATTSLDVARAFAVYAFGVPRDHECSVYRVELDDPIVADPEFRSDEYVSFVMSHWGAVLEVVEEKVTMTVDEARQVFSRYARWVDESPVYDNDGYATVPPIWRTDNRFDSNEIRQELRTLGTYPEPHAVLEFLNERFP